MKTDTGCSKIMWRTLCKDYGQFIIEQLAGYRQSDLNCISTLCSDKKVSQCCNTVSDLTNALKGQSPDTLRIDSDQFNNMAAITNGAVGSVDAGAVSSNKPKPKPWKPKPNQPAVEKPKVVTKEVGDKPWAAELGWNKDANGHFHYSSGGKKADPDFVPEGCHTYAHVDLCFSGRQGDSWVLRKARNMKLNELQCVGYLCNHESNEKCCGTLLAVKNVINGKNWHELAEYEETFDKMMRATGEYLQ